MTICPIALAIGCKKCPIFKICPVKSLIGDVAKATAVKPVVKRVVKSAAKSVAKPSPARKKSRK